jgi:hypothetical protein
MRLDDEPPSDQVGGQSAGNARVNAGTQTGAWNVKPYLADWLLRVVHTQKPC